jgi:hypothetical protein
MAAWQFDISFMPRESATPSRVEDRYDGAPLPETVAMPAHAWLYRNQGEPWPMVDGWLVFGKEDGDRFDFLFNEDRSACLSARIDLRGDHDLFVRSVCELAVIAQCRLFSAELEAAIEPSVAELSAAVKNSSAAKFVKNQRQALDDDEGDSESE